MTKYSINGPEPAPIPVKSTTGLLLIDCLYGYRDGAAWGKANSSPSFEQNVAGLLASFRAKCEGMSEDDCPFVFHCQERKPWTDSPLHPAQRGPYGPQGEDRRAVDFAEFARPRISREGQLKYLMEFDEPSQPTPENPRPTARFVFEPDKTGTPCGLRETLLTKHSDSVFINTPSTRMLKDKGIKTLLIAGLTTDGSVSTAVRAAFNRALVGEWGGKGNVEDADMSKMWTDGVGWYVEAGEERGEEEDELAVEMPRIILIEDATRLYGDDEREAQVFHKAHVRSLSAFAEIRTTTEVLGALNAE